MTHDIEEASRASYSDLPAAPSDAALFMSAPPSKLSMMEGDAMAPDAPPAPAAVPPVTWKSRLERLQLFVITHFVIISFAISLTWALAWPYPGKEVLSIMIMGDVHLIQELNMIIVFFISGLTLKTDEMMKALKSWKVLLYGFVTILFLTSLLGFVFRVIPLQTKAFNIGLMIFCVTPTTLGIGVALVRAAKGDEATALLLTVGTNCLGVATMPIMLRFLFLGYDTDGMDVSVDILNLFLKLLVTIVAPSAVGKALRELVPPVQKFTANWRTALSLFSTANLAFIVWQTLSGARDTLFDSPAIDIVAVILLAIAQHFFYLFWNYIIVYYIIRPPIREGIAVGIMASQKSAPVAVTVISYLTSNPSTQGLLAIPAITGQLCMIFMAAILAPFLARKVTEHDLRLLQQQQSETELQAAGPSEDGSGQRGCDIVGPDEDATGSVGDGRPSYRTMCTADECTLQTTSHQSQGTTSIATAGASSNQQAAAAATAHHALTVTASDAPPPSVGRATVTLDVTPTHKNVT